MLQRERHIGLPLAAQRGARVGAAAGITRLQCLRQRLGNEPLWLADLAGGRLLSLDLQSKPLTDWACALAGGAITPDERARLIGGDRPCQPRCRP